jgi:protein-S-isoprenylcysteine O-methyltransferase Ste14
MSTSIFIWIIYAFWVVLILYLIVSAKGAKKDTQGHLLQSFGLMFAIIAAFLLPYLPIFSFVNFAPVNPVASGIGVIVCVAGMGLFISARQHLGRNWSQTVAAKEGHELVTSGPYRYVRHPMYTGGFIACVGSATVAGGAFIFLLVFLGAIFRCPCRRPS